MKQLLGVADTSGYSLGTAEIPPYIMYPQRVPSPVNFYEKSAQSVSASTATATATAQSSSRIPRHNNQDANYGMQHLGSSVSFASLFGPGSGSGSANNSVLNNTNVLSYPQTVTKQAYNHTNSDTSATAQLIYNSNFSGLESYGASGMTILEELTDLSLRVCENGRIAGQKHHSRGAALLTSNGKVYSGCDVYLNEMDSNGITAERSAVTSAVADGSSVFQCLVLSTDTQTIFPAPNGQSREFLRSFGIFPVILVNCDLDMK